MNLVPAAVKKEPQNRKNEKKIEKSLKIMLDNLEFIYYNSKASS